MRNYVFALLIFMPAALLSAEPVELTVVYTAETHAALDRDLAGTQGPGDQSQPEHSGA